MLSRLSLIFLLSLPATSALSDGHLRMECHDLDPSNDGDADTAFLCLADYQERLEALEAMMSKLIDANSTEPFIHSDSFAAASHGDEAHAKAYMTSLPPEVLNVVPAGAVVAFDLSDGCPDGWAPFAASQSRTIIGASFGMPSGLFRDEELRQRKYRDHGGEETVALSPNEMPQHRHGSGTLASSSGTDFLHTNPNLGVTLVPSGNLGVTLDATGGYLANTGSHEHSLSGSTAESGGSAPHENMPPFLALFYCKKDG